MLTSERRQRPALLQQPDQALWWLFATLAATLSMGRFYSAGVFCVWMACGVLTAFCSMPSVEARPPPALAIGIRVGCGIPAMEVYRMLQRIRSANDGDEDVNEDVAVRGQLQAALCAHAVNLVAALVVVELVAASKLRAWAGLRFYLSLIAVNGVCSVALVHVMAGGPPYPAPGGTSPSPATLVMCSLVSLAIALGATPSARSTVEFDRVECA